MVRTILSFLLVALAGACAAPNPPSATPAPATPAPPVPAPATPVPVEASASSAPTGQPKTTYSQCHVEGPYIAMTFDDGPHAELLRRDGLYRTLWELQFGAAAAADATRA